MSNQGKGLKVFTPAEIELTVANYERAAAEYNTQQLELFDKLGTDMLESHPEGMQKLEHCINFFTTVKMATNFFVQTAEHCKRRDFKAAREVVARYRALCANGTVNPFITLDDV